MTLDEYQTVLWYVAMCAEKLGVGLDDVALVNLRKLQDRKARGITKGQRR